MSCRKHLPNRRDNSSRDFEWNGSRWALTVGWTEDGRVGEIFLKGAKLGTHLEGWAEDDCFIVSRLLQRGERIGDLAASLGNAQSPTGIARPSLIAVAVALAAEIEAGEEGFPFRSHRTMAEVGAEDAGR